MSVENRSSLPQPLHQQSASRTLLVGLTLSVLLVAWAVLDAPGAAVVRWVALLPFGLTLPLYFNHQQPAPAATATLPPDISTELRRANEALTQQVQDLTQLRDVMLAMGASFDREAILNELTNAIMELLHFDRGLVLLFDEKREGLTFGAYTHAAPDPESQFMLEQLQLDLAEAENDPLIGPWLKGEPVLVEDAAPYLPSRLNWLLTTLDLRRFYSVPLTVGDNLRGVILADNSITSSAITQEQRGLLNALGANIAITLENARLYRMTDEQLSNTVTELKILSQIDRELNDALSADRVLNLTLDWALRFTGSDAAVVALIDETKQELRFVSAYGFDPDTWAELQEKTWPLEKGITGRVARTGKSVNVGDVQTDPDFVKVLSGTQSQLSVPLTRENRVIAVMSLESTRPNAFTEANIAFVMRLAARAAVAIDNANLFDETRRERQKLEIILGNISDVVIVIDHDDNLVLVNQAAMGAFRLPPREQYAGRPVNEVFEHTKLLPHYRRAVELKQALVGELTLYEERTFHISIVPAPQVGWSIVMHDITPFKETEKLKNELVATTSHDLKNPLGSIMGYIDLIAMTNPLNEQGQEYLRRVQRAVGLMRQLIDDLLDMARIESGIDLEYEDVMLSKVVNEIVENFDYQVTEKEMQVELAFSPNLPRVPADESRLRQILSNLISNAIKYTQPEGHVRIEAEPREGYLHIAIKDDGMGISPEDQAQVFERFFRVRTAETDSIEGTGLGLAIVKSLVQAHGGQIGLESRLGEGTTFYFTLPLIRPTAA